MGQVGLSCFESLWSEFLVLKNLCFFFLFFFLEYGNWKRAFDMHTLKQVFFFLTSLSNSVFLRKKTKKRKAFVSHILFFFLIF